MDQYNGHYIYSAISATHVFELSDVNQSIALIRDTELPVKNLYVSLTEDSHTFVYLDDGSFAYVQESVVEPGLYQGSGHQALAAVLSTLKADMPFLQGLTPVKVYWQTDSHNCFLFLSKGSRQPAIQARPVLFLLPTRFVDCAMLQKVNVHPQCLLTVSDSGMDKRSVLAIYF